MSSLWLVEVNSKLRSFLSLLQRTHDNIEHKPSDVVLFFHQRKEAYSSCGEIRWKYDLQALVLFKVC